MMIAETILKQLERDPSEPMIRFAGVWYDRGWLRDRINELEAAIRATGVAADAPIGFVPHSRPEFAASLLSLIAHQRTIVMLYAYQSAAALAGKLRELRLPVVVASAEQWTAETLGAADETGAAAIAVALEPPGTVTLTPWLPRPGIEQRPPPPQPGIDLLTSGTTGAPKHFHLSYACLERRGIVATVSKTGDKQPALTFFPLGNISGVYWVLPTIATGKPIIMLEKFSVPEWLDYVRTYRPKDAGLPTAAFRMILDANVPAEELTGFQSFATGASTLDPKLRREFEARYGIPITQSYGATEFGGVVTVMSLADRLAFGEAKADSVGKPIPGVKLRITDPDTGDELPSGADGRLEVVVPAMGEDWIRTTDLACVDEAGFLWHRGRLDGAIMRGGFKVLPDPIANLLLEHEAIAAVAIVGVPDDRLGAVPAAVIQLRPGASEPSTAELGEHIRRALPAISVPKYYRFVEQLPRTPSLKIDLGQARRLFTE